MSWVRSDGAFTVRACPKQGNGFQQIGLPGAIRPDQDVEAIQLQWLGVRSERQEVARRDRVQQPRAVLVCRFHRPLRASVYPIAKPEHSRRGDCQRPRRSGTARSWLYSTRFQMSHSCRAGARPTRAATAKDGGQCPPYKGSLTAARSIVSINDDSLAIAHGSPASAPILVVSEHAANAESGRFGRGDDAFATVGVERRRHPADIRPLTGTRGGLSRRRWAVPTLLRQLPSRIRDTSLATRLSIRSMWDNHAAKESFSPSKSRTRLDRSLSCLLARLIEPT